MKTLNFGSLNVDYVYSVDHMVVGGETLLSSKMEAFCGGKGLNQSVALARAGVEVSHAGQIGEDGQMLLDLCRENGIHTEWIRSLPVKGGHTIIQVDKNGQNSILLYGGTNQMLTEDFIDEVISHFGEGDYLVLQNEVNLLDRIIDKAWDAGMKIVLNPSPFEDKLLSCDLGKVALFMLNEIEGEQFTGEKEPDRILDVLTQRYPKTDIVLTLGSKGAIYAGGGKRVFQDIFPVKAVDTTAAGDTFTGFFLSGIIKGKPPEEALLQAAKASSIAVTRPGAAPSIPTIAEVEEALKAGH